jgi:hypothetical protein
MEQPFEVEMCYCGARESLVTHINNLKELSVYLKMTPTNVKNYFADRLETWTAIEGKTLKVKGLLKKSNFDILVEEILESS